MKNLARGWLVVAMLIISHLSYGQDNWIQILDLSNTRLSARTLQYKSQVSNDEATRQFYYAKFKPIHESQKNGELRFRLPGIKDLLVAEAMNIETEDLKNYTWYGELTNAAGSVSFVSTDGVLRGSISYDDKNFEIHSLGDDLYGIVELQAATDQAGCISNTLSENIAPSPPSSSKNSRVLACTQDNVRILIMTTQRARARDPNFAQTAANAVNQFNSAISASGVTGRARLSLVGVENINFNENPANATNDIARFRTIALPRRNALNADLAILFTDGNYDNGGLLGQVANIGPSDPDAYGIVEIDRYADHYTFAHEVGHLFGAQHQQCAQFNRAGCSPLVDWDHGYGYSYRRSGIFQQREYKKTIMYQIGDGRSPQLRFSNPGIQHEGTPTGTAASNDVARQLDASANAIANLRGGGTLSASINGPTNVPVYTQRSWEVFIRCGNAPYNVTWEFSTDGFNYSNGGTGEVFTYRPLGGTYLYLRCRVRSNDGQNRTSFLTVYVSGGSGQFREGDVQEEKINWISGITQEELIRQNSTVLLDAFPNPANGEQVALPFFLPEAEVVDMKLISVTGQEVYVSHQENYSSGPHQIFVDSNSLPSGVYLYRLSTKSGIYSKRLTIEN